MFKLVKYHSTEWALWTQLGWVTHSVNCHGMAKMLEPKRRIL